MAEKITQQQVEYFISLEDDEFYVDKLREKHGIAPDSSVFHTSISRLVDAKKLKRRGRGLLRKIKKVKPVQVFSKERERRPPFELFFPKDFNTGMEMDFAKDIVIREGDIVTIGGMSNWGKTTLALNFCGENIRYKPVLMGNEYTTRVGDTDEFEPTPRFLNRLDAMDWVEWANGDGIDNFTLLPVRTDYAEQVEKDRINIIDWINLEANKLYDISRVMDEIKAEIGRGIAIPVLQKSEGSNTARGGQFVLDFTDCELNIDKFTDRESMLTIGKVKEYTAPVIGRKFAFGIMQGVKIINFREIVKCNVCYGKGWKKSGNSNAPCDVCFKTGYVNKEG